MFWHEVDEAFVELQMANYQHAFIRTCTASVWLVLYGSVCASIINRIIYFISVNLVMIIIRRPAKISETNVESLFENFHFT